MLNPLEIDRLVQAGKPSLRNICNVINKDPQPSGNYCVAIMVCFHVLHTRYVIHWCKYYNTVVSKTKG